MSALIHVGQKFPDFSLANQDGQVTALASFAGHWLVVFAYPKDDTPGCTLEGRGFSAAKADFDRINARVAGLSQDDVASHKSFCNKFGFTIPLLADPQAQLLNALGVQKSDYKGTMYWNRTSFLVDPQGVIRKVYEKVNPEGHEKAVLEDIKSLQ
jgi:peroxiredoxin Q/BCP